MSLLDDIKKYFTLFSPALALIPGVGPVMPLVNIAFTAIGEAEQIAGATGQQKFDHALAAAADAINIYNAAAGKNFNTSQMMTVLTKMINDGVEFCNVVGAFTHTSQPKA